MLKPHGKTKDIALKRLIRTGLPLFALVLNLSSCSTVAPPAPNVPVKWENREVSQRQLTSWKLNGKIAVISAKDAGSASIDWTQRVDKYHISLLGPLGSHGVNLSGRPGFVKMETADGKQATAGSPEQLLSQQLGWNLPVSHLVYWIRGVPAPSIPATKHQDAYGRLSSLTQEGWHITYPSYTKLGEIDVPSRLVMTSSNLKVKIVVYNWQNLH